MKTQQILALLATVSMLCSNNATAQETAQDSTNKEMRTLLGGDGDMDHGGWGGISTAYSRIMDQDAILVGVRCGWIIDHRVTIGLAGYGLTTPTANKAYDQYLLEQGDTVSGTSKFNMGYGGLFIEPVIAYRWPVHISLPVIIGAGGASYETERWDSWHSDEDLDLQDHSDRSSDGQAFFVVEPGLDIEVNVCRLLRFGFGASYRYTTDVDLPATSSDVLHGMNASFSIKVGAF